MNDRAYLDWAATAPLRAEAASAMAAAAARPSSGEWANPSSVHGPGRAARRALNEAQDKCALVLALHHADMQAKGEEVK